MAVRQIVGCRLDEAPGRRGVGVRLEPEGWTTRFLMSGDNHVLIKYRDERGKMRILRFSASDPEGLVRAIRARVAAAGAKRIDVADGVDVAADAETRLPANVDAEVEAASAHSRADS